MSPAMILNLGSYACRHSSRTRLCPLWTQSRSSSSSPLPNDTGPPSSIKHPESSTPERSPATSGATPTAGSTTISTTSGENGVSKPPPYLPRPLGVEEVPSTAPATKEEKLAKLVDEESRLRERKHIISEVSKGYYHDWATLRHNGNKLWTAPPSLIREERSLYFPDIKGIAISNKQMTHTTDLFGDKITLLAVESTRMSEEHTRSFYVEPTRMLAGEPDFQLLRLNVQENPLKSWLVSLFINNLKRNVPAHQQSRYLLSNQNLEYIREPLGMVNKLLGYVYLVDWDRKVRWAGCGFANAEEMRGLFTSSRALLKRFSEKKQLDRSQE
ncbi:ATP10 protein-domain-containing protein [Melampsora americana]|nr:ATP10 protein-domain-containing protein [Melampsora americana]